VPMESIIPKTKTERKIFEKRICKRLRLNYFITIPSN
jgi:hypothetical protein